MKIKAFFIGFDTFERHRIIASQIIPRTSTILDVGGDKGKLSFFCDASITDMNLLSGDVIGNGMFLPFHASSFEIVVSLDVLEHIPKNFRGQFISELIRVAQSKVIFCAPYGSPQHEIIENNILDILIKSGNDDVMLSEHVKYGLPTLEEIREYISSCPDIKILFSGDYRFNALLFRIDHWMGTRFKFIKIGISIILNLIGNLIIYPFTLSDKPNYYTNRITVVVTKEHES